MMTQRKFNPFKLTATAVFTALVGVVTMIFSVYVPDTEGFFNVGESMVFLTALLFGPLVGSFAGGVGSMFADLLLGYPHYAPATLMIKACEGAVVGILAHKKPRFHPRYLWKTFTFCIGLVAGLLLGGIGSLYYSGTIQLYLGFPQPITPNIILFVPPELWYLLGAIVVFLVTLTGFVLEPEYGWMVFSVIIGGFVMVSGYFIYQMFFIGWLFNIPVVAIAEIPINVGQMIIGAVIALPIAKIVRRTFPHLASS